MRRRVTIVVPCYNEAARLDAPAYLAFLGRAGDVDFLFVDDGSEDATAQRLDALRQEAPDRIRIHTLARNVGKAEAIRHGVLLALAASPEYVGYWDADLATPLDEIPVFCDILDRRTELRWVMGSRVRLLGRRIERRVIRHYAGRVFATTVSMLLGLPVYDTQCGAKVFRAGPALEVIFQQPFMTRWLVDVELLYRFMAEASEPRPADAVCEVPLTLWRDVAGSKLRARDFARAALELFRLHMRFGRRSRRALQHRFAAVDDRAMTPVADSVTSRASR
jgi:dolichyl-phosphate beta-glucosyltransferase